MPRIWVSREGIYFCKTVDPSGAYRPLNARKEGQETKAKVRLEMNTEKASDILVT